MTAIPGTYTLVLLSYNGCAAEYTVEVSVDTNCDDDCGPLIISCPQDVTVQCAEDWSPFGVSGEPVFRKDKKCPDIIDVGWTDLIMSNCPYVIRRTYWAEDTEGTYETCVQYITVIDEVAPIFMEVPQDINMACDADIDGMEMPSVWAYDECTKMNIEAEHTVTTQPGDCAGSYTITHTWTATDQCGNTGTASWTINVQDTEAPSLSCTVKDTEVDCHNVPKPVKCEVTDNCDTEVVVTVEDEEGATDEVGKYVITRTYSATDDCGNTTTIVQLITVWCDKKPSKDDGTFNPKILASVAPNPFREESTITFRAVERGTAQVEVTDMHGRKVADLFNGRVEAGVPVRLTFHPADNSGGVFLYRIRLNGEEIHGRMLFQP
ncbi:MAG: hypothetical protein IPG92_13490 [Flavobacteriales bacterium]|nr:hypothetical protein [Flavobacteriales bacterium]